LEANAEGDPRALPSFSMAGRDLRDEAPDERNEATKETEGLREATGELIGTKKQKGNMVLYGANTCTRGAKSTNCVKIARYPRLVSYNSEANVRIVKKSETTTIAVSK
jgi:hypothetical protein